MIKYFSQDMQAGHAKRVAERLRCKTAEGETSFLLCIEIEVKSEEEIGFIQYIIKETKEGK